MSYRDVPMNANGEASDNSPLGGYGGFVVVKLEAVGPANRTQFAEGYVDGVKVICASASDNSVPNVISNAVSGFTMPVPPGSTWKVRGTPGPHVEIRWCARF